MTARGWTDLDVLAREVAKTESRPEAILLVALWPERGKWNLRTQYPVGDYRVDIAVPEARIAIEVDGHDWHRTNGDMVNDLARQNDMTYADWTVLRFPASKIYAASGQYLPEIVREIKRRLKPNGAPIAREESTPLPSLDNTVNGGLLLLAALGEIKDAPDWPMVPRRKRVP